MPIEIKYTGTQQRWPELATTGKQSVWMPGQIEERDDVEAGKLLATGLFKSEPIPLTATLSAQGVEIQNPTTGNPLSPADLGWDFESGGGPSILSSNFRSYLDGIATPRESLLVLRKVSAGRFEVFTPGYQRGMWYRWRWDNDATQFVDASPSDTALGLARPYLQTTVQESFLEGAVADITASSATASGGTPTAAVNYMWLNTVGAYFEFSVTDVSRLRLAYWKNTNSGTFEVTIDGSPALVNLLPKDANGKAVIDAYGASATNMTVMIADNLPAGAHTVRITVTGKNAASADSRCYLLQLTGGALRTYSPWAGTGVFTETAGSALKVAGSAVDYAVAFVPQASATPSSPFFGSVHGYENRNSLVITYDGATFDFAGAADGTVVTAQSNITIEQTTSITHPEATGTTFANVSSCWTASRRGFASNYTWTWEQPVKVFNGYTEMWTVYGANSGGAGGPLIGWADNVRIGPSSDYRLINGDSAELGSLLAEEVLFWGSPYNAATASGRNTNAGDTLCLVSFPSLQSSFLNFAGPTSKTDAIWIQDRATFRKLYLQSMRNLGNISAGVSMRGGKSVSFYTLPNAYKKI